LRIEAERTEVIESAFDAGMGRTRCGAPNIGYFCDLLFFSSSIFSVSIYLLTHFADVVRAMMLKMDLSALHSAASDLGMTELVEGLPASTEDSVSATSATIQSWDEAMLRRIHRLLFEVALVEGSLVCPETGRKFPVRDGIPNMLLHEDEV
jgi:uncharacterized protein YbaR (Trm112 family)